MRNEPTAWGPSAVFARRYWVVILLPTVVAVAVTAALSWGDTRLFEADAKIFLSRYSVNVSLAGGQPAVADSVAVSRAQADVAESLQVAKATLEAVGTPADPSTLQDFARRSRVAAGDAVMTLSVADPDGNRAQQLAAAWAEESVALRRTLDARPLRAARARLAERIEEARDSGGRRSELVRSLIDKQSQLEAMEAIQLANGIVFQPAQSVRRLGTPFAKKLAFAGVAGLLLGVALALLLESRRSSRPPRPSLPDLMHEDDLYASAAPRSTERLRT